jgi:hypothetical protein
MAVTFSPRLFAAVAGALLTGSNAVAQVVPRGHLPGVTYTIQVASTPHGGPGGGAMAGPAQNYTGRAIFAANRGRMDIVEGSVESLLSKGDYILFDSTDLVIVHPASKSFVPLPHDVAGQTMERLESIGVKVTLADEKVALDSLGFGDTVSGIPTAHYRLTTAFTMSLDAGVIQQRLGTQSVTDYWVGSVPGLPRNPLLRANGLAGPSAMTGMFKSISRKVDSVAKRMGSAIALRTSTVSRLIDGQGDTTTMEQTSDVSNIEHRDVDDSVLVLPPDYRPRALGGVEEGIADDAGAKWRIRPRPRPTKIERTRRRLAAVGSTP